MFEVCFSALVVYIAISFVVSLMFNAQLPHDFVVGVSWVGYGCLIIGFLICLLFTVC